MLISFQFITDLLVHSSSNNSRKAGSHASAELWDLVCVFPVDSTRLSHKSYVCSVDGKWRNFIKMPAVWKRWLKYKLSTARQWQWQYCYNHGWQICWCYWWLWLNGWHFNKVPDLPAILEILQIFMAMMPQNLGKVLLRHANFYDKLFVYIKSKDCHWAFFYWKRKAPLHYFVISENCLDIFLNS